MISHFSVKEYLSFDEAHLEFESGLVVFTGASGSGKSILINAVLATLGHGESLASLAEILIERRIDLEEFGIESDEFTTFKQLKKGNTRFFINNQSISRKILSDVSSRYVRHLSHKDFSDFDQKTLLDMIDQKVALKNSAHLKRRENFADYFKKMQCLKKELSSIKDEEKRLSELREFAQFELEKIDRIAPRVGEDEELDAIKKRLTKKEKIVESIGYSLPIFDFEEKVTEALTYLDIDSAFFDEAMNELKAHFDTANEMMEDLEELDIEQILDRIEAISELKRRYGSIEEALVHREEKAKELEHYDNFEADKKRLEDEINTLESLLKEEADSLHVARMGVVESLEKRLNTYTDELYLRKSYLKIDFVAMHESGVDSVEIGLEGTNLDKISSGEFNRLRLAILALRSDLLPQNEGILILDEIDANLSGEESMSVAHVLLKLAKTYQIFAISHQPQLTSQASQHFLVYKEGVQSYVKSLDEDERISEIARMISGDEITPQAKQFAMTLRSVS